MQIVHRYTHTCGSWHIELPRVFPHHTPRGHRWFLAAAYLIGGMSRTIMVFSNKEDMRRLGMSISEIKLAEALLVAPWVLKVPMAVMVDKALTLRHGDRYLRGLATGGFLCAFLCSLNMALAATWESTTLGGWYILSMLLVVLALMMTEVLADTILVRETHQEHSLHQGRGINAMATVQAVGMMIGSLVSGVMMHLWISPLVFTLEAVACLFVAVVCRSMTSTTLGLRHNEIRDTHGEVCTDEEPEIAQDGPHDGSATSIPRQSLPPRSVGSTDDHGIGTRVRATGTNGSGVDRAECPEGYWGSLAQFVRDNPVPFKLLLMNFISMLIPGTGTISYFFLQDELGYTILWLGAIATTAHGVRILALGVYEIFLRKRQIRRLFVTLQFTEILIQFLPVIVASGIYKSTGIPAFMFVLSGDVMGEVLDSLRAQPMQIIFSKAGTKAVLFQAGPSVTSIALVIHSVLDAVVIDLFHVGYDSLGDLESAAVFCTLLECTVPIVFMLWLLPNGTIRDVVTRQDRV